MRRRVVAAVCLVPVVARACYKGTIIALPWVRNVKYMTTRRPVKERPPRRNRMKAGRPLLVGVIASAADLRFVLAMKEPPDLFELRLDCLCEIANQLHQNIDSLRAPIIITPRHPRHVRIA